MNTKTILESVYRVIVIATLLYIGYELNSLKALTNQNQTEINFVTSKLDYVTSDINMQKVVSPQ